MKMKEGFVMREVAGQNVVIAIGEASKNFHGMIKLNRTGKDIWESLQKGLSEEEIVTFLKDKYQVEQEEVEKDVREFLNQIQKVGILSND